MGPASESYTFSGMPPTTLPLLAPTAFSGFVEEAAERFLPSSQPLVSRAHDAVAQHFHSHDWRLASLGLAPQLVRDAQPSTSSVAYGIGGYPAGPQKSIGAHGSTSKTLACGTESLLVERLAQRFV